MLLSFFYIVPYDVGSEGVLDSGSDTYWSIEILQLCHIGANVLFTWTLPPLDQTLFDFRDLRAGCTQGWWVLEDLPCAVLLAPLEATGSAGLRAGAPLAPLTHFAVHCPGESREREVRGGKFEIRLRFFATCRYKNLPQAPNNRIGTFNGSIFLTDLVACTPWPCHWARSPLDRHGGTSHWSWYRPGRHCVHVSLFTHDSHSAGHSAKTKAQLYIREYSGQIQHNNIFRAPKKLQIRGVEIFCKLLSMAIMKRWKANPMF